jgi:hypothetical protein
VEVRAAAVAELAGKLLTVSAVLLPVIGVAARSVALIATGLAPVPVASEASIAELTLSGLVPASVLGLTVLAAYGAFSASRAKEAYLARLQRSGQELSDAGGGPFAGLAFIYIFEGIHDWYEKVVSRIKTVLSILFAIGLVLFLPGFPASMGFVVLEAWVLLQSRSIARRQIERSTEQVEPGPGKRTTIYPLIFPLVLSLFLASIWAGLAGVGVGVVKVRYAFEPNARLTEDAYLRLAESDSRLYLMPCVDDPQVMVVPSDQVILAQLSPGFGPVSPSFFAVLKGTDVELGLEPRCQ